MRLQNLDEILCIKVVDTLSRSERITVEDSRKAAQLRNRHDLDSPHLSAYSLLPAPHPCQL
jgi:16S rRNA C1402 (ribose-2'-O) methylase RsmI